MLYGSVGRVGLLPGFAGTAGNVLEIYLIWGQGNPLIWGEDNYLIWD